MQTTLVLVAATGVVAVLLGLAGQASAACGTAPNGLCCVLACPVFSPCALTKQCPGSNPPPPVDPLPILQKIFDGIAAIFKSVEALLPPGSPVLGILDNIFTGIADIFGKVEAGLGGRRKRAYNDKCDADDDEGAGYGYAKKKHEGKIGYKSAKAANEGIAAIGSLKDAAVGDELEKLVNDNKHLSAEDRKKSFKEAMGKYGDAKDKLDKVLVAYATTLDETKTATEKLVAKFSAEAKEAGTKLIAVVLDEKLTPDEKEAKIDEQYGAMKPEVKKELGLKDIAYVKRACHIASCPFATLGSKRVPVRIEF